MNVLLLDDLIPNFDVMSQAAKLQQKQACSHCGSKIGVEKESSRTMYHWDGKGQDPNADILFCRPCASFHHDYWDEMWNEYYSGIRC
jgi:hypothetical protein